MSSPPSISIALVVLLLTTACTTGRTGWLQVGSTTKTEVVQRYGEPDVVRVLLEEEMVTYRPLTLPHFPPVIPIAGAGPSGLIVTDKYPILRGLGMKEVAAGTDPRPLRELHIRYDAEGIVRDVRD